MNYLSNNNLAYLSDDNVYKSTFGIVENNEIINNDYDDNKDGTKEKNEIQLSRRELVAIRQTIFNTIYHRQIHCWN